MGMERQVLGLHKPTGEKDLELDTPKKETDISGTLADYEVTPMDSTVVIEPVDSRGNKMRSSQLSRGSSLGYGALDDDMMGDYEYLATYAMKDRLKSYALRTVVVALMVFVAMILESSFNDVMGFIGSTTMTGTCVVLPLVIYLRMAEKSQRNISKTERIVIYVTLVVSIAIAVYSAVDAIRNIVDNISKYTLFHVDLPQLSGTSLEELDSSLC